MGASTMGPLHQQQRQGIPQCIRDRTAVPITEAIAHSKVPAEPVHAPYVRSVQLLGDGHHLRDTPAPVLVTVPWEAQHDPEVVVGPNAQGPARIAIEPTVHTHTQARYNEQVNKRERPGRAHSPGRHAKQSHSSSQPTMCTSQSPPNPPLPHSTHTATSTHRLQHPSPGRLPLHPRPPPFPSPSSRALPICPRPSPSVLALPRALTWPS